MKTCVSFDASKKDLELIRKITDRMLSEIQTTVPCTIDDSDAPAYTTAISMDITAAHCNGCPLDLDKLLHADLFTFLHDVAGISKHLDRSTGKLQHCFVPRCTVAKKEPV